MDKEARIKELEQEFGIANGILTSGDIAKTREYLCLLGMLDNDPNIILSIDMDRCTGGMSFLVSTFAHSPLFIGSLAAKRGEYYTLKNSFFHYHTGQATLSPNPGMLLLIV